MSRRMSVSMTLDAVRDRRKTVTRRHVDTWQHLKPGDRLTLIEKGMGLPKGAKQVVVAEVEVVAVRVVPLWPIGWSEIEREGLWDQAREHVFNDDPEDSPSQWFCRFWLAGHGYKATDDWSKVPCRRIEWRYLDHAETVARKRLADPAKNGSRSAGA